jgi:hypothetical protein
LPVVTGGGALVRIIAHGDEAADTLKFVSGADQLSELVRRVDQAVPAAKAVTNVTPAALETIQRLDIRPYSAFTSADKGGLPAHHLVEKRFWRQLGFADPTEAYNKILADVIDPSTHHQDVTGQIRARIGYSNQPGLNTDTAALQDIWNAHRDVYNNTGHSDWGELVWQVYFEGTGVTK